MALDLSLDALNRRVDSLRNGWAGHYSQVRTRNQAYLRAFSPSFDVRLGEHDQWPDPFRQEAESHARSSYNVTRAVVELWTALEASDLPAIRWWEQFVPTPAPATSEAEAAQRQVLYRAEKIVAQQLTTMREQRLLEHLRRANAGHHFYQAVLRKNVFGHSWLKTWPDTRQRRFRIATRIDPSTVFPVFSYADDDEGRLEAVLVAYRRSAQSVNAQFPGLLKMDRSGATVTADGYYTPTAEPTSDADRAFVWFEDYWLLDDEWLEEPGSNGEPTRSRVANLRRVNGQVITREPFVYEDWRHIPYVPFENENLRDRTGFSDAGTMLPFQDSTNRFLSQQQDVIAGESRPKFKYRGDADRQIILEGEQVIPLDPDEDIEQIAVRLDVFPTQIHGQQLADLMSRATGLPDTVWGRITAAQNSGRALSTAWRAVAARLVPRRLGNERALRRMLGMWCDWLEQYDWAEDRLLFDGNRDFDLEFPNQEPRDFTEVSLDAINRMNAGIITAKKAMELTGETSPDEMDEAIRAEYLDTVRHPEKAQAYILLQRLKQQVEIEAQQAGLQMAAAMSQLQGAGPGPTPDQQAGAASQARAQAAAQAAPTRPEGANQPAPATAPGAAANPAETTFGTLVQDGRAFNRVVDRGTISQ